MKEICPAENCMSCAACYSICPVDAISMIQNDKGFYRPAVDEETCVDCLLCQTVCPATMPASTHAPLAVFACWSKEDSIRDRSSSGGFFTHLSSSVLNRCGVVFGGGFAEDFRVTHQGVQNKEEFPNLQGSKYVQSRIGESFREVRKFLKEDRQVLFAGVPCQVAGLKNFLETSNCNRENLLLVDLVCHGAPSPYVYERYLQFQEDRYQSMIESLSFRRKPMGWQNFGMEILFQSGEVYFKNLLEDPYIVGFLKNYFLNDSCYQCRFASEKREGDITIADFWGYQGTTEFPDDDKGITLVLINSLKGRRAFEEIKEQIIFCTKDLSEATAGNDGLKKPSFKNHRYDDFWLDFKECRFSELTEKYFQPRIRKKERGL